MKILVVEDEIKIAESIKKGLTQEKFSVDVAYDGLEGYDMAFSENYDVILLDLMLPNMSGVEICRKLRKDNISTPVLMLTAKGELQDKVLGLNIGADDYLTKPFEFEELVARVKALARRPSQVKGTVLTCGKLKLDTIRYKVCVENKEIDLSKKEYELFEYLMRNLDKTVTKEQIMENVWSFDSDILPNTVEVYVGYLRNKLGKKNKFIKTVRGFGYKMTCE